ncbi:hypothetical protein FA15DRAFT_110970 [Coprinopsis marcescibilis]|uniref:Uncharacterized protein n=1 Tax=Coprinopsis marcescibilis TaxID=230819 RepID=A0A5C3KY31_COPMA|nr:hypothetical protein FA15DRAFT_110970 [Coprinopsis marcescibilis]
MDASTNSGGEQNISVSQKRPRSKSPGSLSGQSGEPSRKRTETDDHGSWNHTQNGAQNWGYGGHEKNEQPPTGPRNDVGRRLHWR